MPRYLKLDPAASMAGMFALFKGVSHAVFLDSSLAGPRLGRYSYLTADPFLVLRSKGRHVQIESRGEIQRLESDPFDVLRDLLKGYSQARVQGLPPFQGGAVGYLAYELAHHLETLPRSADDDLGLPEMNIAFYDWVIARDGATGSTWAIATGLPEGTDGEAQERLRWIERRLNQEPAPPRPVVPTPPAGVMRSNFSRSEYVRAVGVVKDYIVEGDIYQANISQRFETPIRGEPWELYLRLRRDSAAPFSAYIGFPEVTVLSASPEEFLRLENGAVITRPMKGTRPRGPTPDEDRRIAAELLASEKDRAENIMIVDLMRSDLGKVCRPGSIGVPEIFTIEEYPTVFQMVSTVSGELRPDVDAVDLLRACYPGGSVTGAPKIRAMEIIDELEPTQRSVYCGAIGYMGFDDTMLMSIPIRIILVVDGTAYVQVGGGIVADSEPDAEYEETMHKARGSFRALGVSE